MVDHKKERELQLMRMMLVAAQTVIIVNDVQETTVAGPLPISIGNAAQTFEGWGTSLAWFAEYVGCLEGNKRHGGWRCCSLSPKNDSLLCSSLNKLDGVDGQEFCLFRTPAGFGGGSSV